MYPIGYRKGVYMNYKVNMTKLNIEMLNRGYSINKIAKLSGLSKSTISRIFKDNNIARAETIFKIANVLRLEATELIIQNDCEI